VIRVVIVAPDSAEQERLRSRAASTEIAVVATGASLESMASVHADAAILAGEDVVTAVMRRRLPPVVVWTDDDGAAARVRSWGLAAWGVVRRGATARQLQAALLAVASGLCVVPPEGVAGAAGARGPEMDDDDVQDAGPQEALTPRERDVLEMASRGLSNRDIGTALGISEHTVKFHLAALYGKLGVSTRTAAVRRGLRQGIIAI
jgi:DNA-binding NarL/FixJ family response regulator